MTERAVFNVALAKLIGLYQILDPRNVQRFSCRNAWFRAAVALVSAFVCAVSAMLCVTGVKIWTYDVDRRAEAVFSFCTAEFLVFTVYEMLLVVYRSHDIWDCLSVARFDFTRTAAAGSRRAHLLHMWRRRTLLFTNLIMTVGMLGAGIYVMSPLWFPGRTNKMNAADGSSGHYRINVLNLYAYMSADTYNAHFAAMHLLESFTVILISFLSIAIDTLLTTLSCALICQLQIINASFESCAQPEPEPKRASDPSHRDSHGTDHKIVSTTEASDKHSVIYNDLMTIIKDHQAVLEKLDKFFSISQQLIRLQLIVSSTVIIIVWFAIIQTMMNQKLETDSGSSIINLMIIWPMLIYKLFMPCYLFGLIHNEKESIIFALYSSNWTEMDMRCKKLILNTMAMNNIHKQKFKFTQLKIVNLEIFLSILSICFSVLSLMLKLQVIKKSTTEV